MAEFLAAGASLPICADATPATAETSAKRGRFDGKMLSQSNDQIDRLRAFAFFIRLPQQRGSSLSPEHQK
jgi:hypothetical protein